MKKYMIPDLSGMKKLLQMMRLTLIVSVLSIIQLAASDIGYAQSKKFTIKVKNVSVESVLKEIRDQSDFDFFYNTDLLEDLSTVNVKVRKAKVTDILDEIIPDHLTYQVVDKTIIIKENPNPKPETPESIEESELDPITGKITADDGEPLPGATILVKGTTTGTVTDVDGNFRIEAESDDILVISFVGFATQEISVGDQTTLDIEMILDSSELGEVVVTAFGLEREVKALGYSVSQVSGEELSRVKSPNALQSLRGKVAGVNISNNALGNKGSTRVVIRGNSSFNGSNQPLYIVDGISLQNQQLGSAGEWGGADNGDGLSAINPDDIESISVLKGGAAAALYGSRASNGVIIIKTKNGLGDGSEGIGVEISNQTVFTSINSQFDPQTEYGNGIAGGYPTDQADVFNSWGPKLDGSSRTTYDGSDARYSYAGDNMERLYSTGVNMSNSIAITSNSEKGNTRVAFTQLNGTDVIETSDLKRQTFSLNTTQILSDKLIVTANIKYSDTREDANPIVATAPMSPNGSIRYFAPNINVDDFIGDFGNGTTNGYNELSVSPNIFNTNPYFALHNNITSADKNRLLGAVSMKYNVLDNLYVRGQFGIDRATNHFNNQTINGAPLFQPGVAYNALGQLFEQTQVIDQYDADFFIGTDNLNITDDLQLNGFLGAGTFSFEAEDVGIFGNQTVIPELYTVLNTASQSGLYGYDAKKISSLYANAELGYKGVAYLTLTARNDWFSTLSAAGKSTPNNDLYGSASLALILSDMFVLPQAVTFAKLRGGYSQVAGGANDPYGLSLSYALVGQGHLGNPLGAVNGGTIPNQSIVPFEKNETEIGFDLRLFDNRVSLDMAYYSNETLGDIVAATTSVTSGYNNTSLNVGEITNKGVELLLKGTVLDKGDLSLDLTLNYANNKSAVIRTDEDNAIIQSGWGTLFQSYIGQIPGNPYGVIYGTSYVRDDQGNIVHQMINGVPIPMAENENKVLGLGVPPTQVGFGANLNYKDFSFYLFLEGKFGGSIVSATNQSLKQLGLHQATVPEGGRGAGFVPDGVLEDGSRITQSLNEAELYEYWTTGSKFAVGEENTYKNDFIRISQISLSYQLPSKLLGDSPFKRASVALIGSNLGFLMNKVPNIDPEAYYNTRNSQGVEAIGMPVGTSVGFSVNLKF